ncbi:MAG: hypothetical protein E7585_04465 [Ruminococcaceae bacterium]|nr:hypothetical protein [Oscillospiraceae bacterium]
MILQSINVAVKTADGNEFSLHKGKGGGYSCRWAEANVGYTALDGGYVLWANAGLKKETARFDAQDAITLRFAQGNVPYLAYYMRCSYWCRPAFGVDLTAVPKRTQALLYKEGSTWRVLWSLCGDVFNCTLQGGEQGLEAKIAPWSDGEAVLEKMPVLLHFSGKEPHTVLEKTAKAAAKLLNGRVTTVYEKPFPELFEYLGWCSWDAMRVHISEQGLLVKVAELKEKGIPVRWCILDDMWAHVKGIKGLPEEMTTHDMVKIMHQSTLHALEADPDRFPNGLAGAIEKLHNEGLRVGVWYPTTGYWKGVDPEGPLAAELADILEMLPNENLLVKPNAEAANRFHNAIQDMLKDAGADFVKVDNQTHYKNKYSPVHPVGVVAKAVQNAIEDVTEAHFGNALINCMGMGNESMWNRRKSAVSRCSGDFQPENREWFAKHIQQCAYNSLFQGQFHYSDWDMWWTDDEQALKNSVCRAVSGGPIYVSDKIGRSRPEALKPLCFADGRILRADGQATPIARCLLENPTVSHAPLFIFNKANGCGVVAAFNIHAENQAQEGWLSPADLKLPAGRYLVREQLRGETRVLEKGETLSVSLADNDAFALYIFYSLKGNVTPLGRVDKFISPKALLGRNAKGVKLYEGGPVAFVGVDFIATNKRERVEGEKMGNITVFALEKDETAIRYLQ